MSLALSQALNRRGLRWHSVDWVTSNLASWLAVTIALVAALIAWRTLRSSTYVEIHPDWTIRTEDDGQGVTVVGRVTVVSPSAFLGGSGTLKFSDKSTIQLLLKDASRHMRYANTYVYTLIGCGNYPSDATGAKLRVTIQLSDGTSKRFKGHAEFEANGG